MKPLVFITGLTLSAFLLAACGKDKAEPLALEEAELGPESKELLKDLPKDLVGDKANARYTSENLQGEDEDGK